MSAARKIDHGRYEGGRWTITALAALLLAGCAGDRLPAAGPAEFASERLHLEHEIRFAEGSETLSPVDIERMKSFLVDADPAGDGDILVRVGAGQEERSTYLQALLRSEGRQASGGIDPAQPQDRAVLSIERDLALPTRCAGDGLWGSDIATDREGLPIGCTTSMNLSAMIDDTGDLVRGHPLGPAAAAPAADLARAYLSRFADRPIDVLGDEGIASPHDAFDGPDGGAPSDTSSGPAAGR